MAGFVGRIAGEGMDFGAVNEYAREIGRADIEGEAVQIAGAGMEVRNSLASDGVTP